MTRLFIDSDVLLDLLIKRDEYQSSAELLSRITETELEGWTTPIVFANIHYIMSRFAGKDKSLHNLKRLRKILSVLTVDEEILDQALYSDAPDFEDALQYSAAEQNGIDFIITRNKRDFAGSRIPVLTASEFLEVELK